MVFYIISLTPKSAQNVVKHTFFGRRVRSGCFLGQESVLPFCGAMLRITGGDDTHQKERGRSFPMRKISSQLALEASVVKNPDDAVGTLFGRD